MKSIDNYQYIIDFLESHRIKDNNGVTHISMGAANNLLTGKFNIQDEEMEQFFRLYNKVFQTNDFFIGELPIEQGPVIIDIDFNYELNINSAPRIYEYDDILKFITLYNKILNKYLKIAKHNSQVFLLEKNKPTIVSRNE
jgi:hypothetical protein